MLQPIPCWSEYVSIERTFRITSVTRQFLQVFSQSFLYALNLWLLLCPAWLSFDWALGSIKLIETITDIRIVPAIFIYLLLFLIISNGSRYNKKLLSLLHTATLHIFFHHRNSHISLALMIIPFIPASGLFVKLGFVIAERVLYIPSIGFCILVVMGYKRLCEQWHRMRYVCWNAIGFGEHCVNVTFLTIDLPYDICGNYRLHDTKNEA